MAHNSSFSHPTHLPNLVMFPSAAREFRAGLLALAPLLVGVMPFGMI
jgi:predicted branched-subunit amino acid permease